MSVAGLSELVMSSTFYCDMSQVRSNFSCIVLLHLVELKYMPCIQERMSGFIPLLASTLGPHTADLASSSREKTTSQSPWEIQWLEMTRLIACAQSGSLVTVVPGLDHLDLVLLRVLLLVVVRGRWSFPHLRGLCLHREGGPVQLCWRLFDTFCSGMVLQMSG